MPAKNPPPLNLDERIDRVLKAIEATRKVIVESAEATRKTVVESAEATRKTVERTVEHVAKAAETTRKSAEATAKAAETTLKAAEAELKAAEANRKAAEADRDRFSRLEKEMAEDRRNNEGSRGNISRAMEDTFAASLPRAIKKTHGIVIRRKDVRVRARKDNNSREYDFIAPNGELVLVGEVKIRLTCKDVESLSDSLSKDFRELFPEYAHLPVYGVVAGGAIDEDAARLARKRGFIILRMEGGKVHPDTGKKYKPTKF